MPRRAKPEPLVTKVESLSTGIDLGMVDDFTGELLPQPLAMPLESAQDILDRANVAKVKAALRLLQAVGIVKVEPSGHHSSPPLSPHDEPAGPRRDSQRPPRPQRITLKRADWRRV